MRPTITQEALLSTLAYSPTTGNFTWTRKSGNRVTVGAVAGCMSSAGYIQIRTGGRLYYAHRLAFLAMTGVLPDKQVDHINGNRGDTRWNNLRLVTPTENTQNACVSKNNKSGVLGVFWTKRRQEWVATITVARKTHYLGAYADIHKATAARKAAEALYGFHQNHGRPAI